jgi:hypothetical protein
MAGRTLEKAGERERELRGPAEVKGGLTDVVADSRRVGKEDDVTCSELPVWNPHQTNMAEKQTASLYKN